MNQSSETRELEHLNTPSLVSRSVFGGVLMGLANLVPGISGGTMLLAAGIYPSFINAVAEVTRFRFRFRSLLLLACVVGAAGCGILLLAGVLKDLVINQRWVMYSLFIGLTLGGIPIVWRLGKPANAGFVIGAVGSFLIMVILALLQAWGVMGSGSSNWLMFLVAGLAGASAMILPGLSGGYLLLLLGQYVPILSAIDQFKEALKAGDISAAMTPALTVILPVGIGVVVGVVAVGNLLEGLINRYRKPTLGILLGLLIGSTVGLFPFQRGVEPEPGQIVKGQVVTTETISEIDKEDWPTEYFQPTIGQVAGSLFLVALGFGLTMGIARIGNEKESEDATPSSG